MLGGYREGVHMEQDTIRARRIELIDETGTQRAVLTASSQSWSGLVVHNFGSEQSGVSASIGVNEAGVPFVLVGDPEQGSVFVSVTSNGPDVRKIDANGQAEVLGG
jgi:hypothetical protein